MVIYRLRQRLRIIRYFSSKKSRSPPSASTAPSFSNTVNLPKTDFPAWISDRAERRRLDDELARRCTGEHLYKWQLERDKSKPLFVVHDGPPYANGDVHIGHAVNKILKDIAVRYRVLRGDRVHFRPGWDCHGLPIELRAMQQQQQQQQKSQEIAEKWSPLEIRRLSKDFASSALAEQRKAFKSWSCLGDWDDPYITMDKEYEAKQVELFYELYRRGLVYRQFKPVHWSPSSRTALADAELKYEPEHMSIAAYFRMKILNFPPPTQLENNVASNPIWALIWTTTPWTLPSNDAIFFNDSCAYCLIRLRGDVYLVSEKSLDTLRKIDGSLEVLQRFERTSFLADLRYVNPIINEEKRFLAAAYVDPAKGTGLTHGSFAHGFDDFAVAQRYGLDVQCFVDEEGNYDRSKYANTVLAGRNVLTEGVDLVLATYRDHVVATESITHSYPYDWRTNRPVIIRACRQWFIDADKLRDRAMAVAKSDVRFSPEWANETMQRRLRERPAGWCISRQRCWGVPLPIFYDKTTDESIVDERTIRHVIEMIKREGSDCWWQYDTDELIPKDSSLRSKELRKGNEIFDIWFDSGLSWAAGGLPTSCDGKITADLIVEGEDQFRGWFQSLLLTSVALQDAAPYRRVLVHGFVVDDDGRKMSKSVGNVVEPSKLIVGDEKNTKRFPPLGVDGLRFWVGISAAQHPFIRLGPEAIEKVESSLRNIRKVLKFALGVLGDFDPTTDAIRYEQMQNIDRYVLHSLANYLRDMESAYDQLDFTSATLAAVRFLNTSVANLFITVAKHRLYCAPRASVERRSAQTVLDLVGDRFVRSIAPILPHLAEEYTIHRRAKSPSSDEHDDTIFKTGWRQSEREWTNDSLADDFDRAILPARQLFLAQYGASKMQQLELRIVVPSNAAGAFRIFEKANEENDGESELKDLMSTADVKISIVGGNEDMKLEVSKTQKHICPRCRRFARISLEDQLCKFCSSGQNLQS